MAQLIIIGVAALASLFLIVFGAVTNNSGILSAGTGILGILTGWLGKQNQATINTKVRALFHVE